MWVVSVVTFLIMFLPRSRQMVAMGKDEMFLDQDQEYCYSHQVTTTLLHLSLEQWYNWWDHLLDFSTSWYLYKFLSIETDSFELFWAVSFLADEMFISRIISEMKLSFCYILDWIRNQQDKLQKSPSWHGVGWNFFIFRLVSIHFSMSNCVLDDWLLSLSSRKSENDPIIRDHDNHDIDTCVARYL